MTIKTSAVGSFERATDHYPTQPSDWGDFREDAPVACVVCGQPWPCAARQGLPPLAKLPISAPLYVWVGYLLLVAVLGVLATAGGLIGMFAVVAAAAFSFQFWTFAVHRGLGRRRG